MRNNAINSLGTLGPFVVGTDLGCNYTSVQNAITAAAAVALQTAPVNVYIKPGIYTENLTLAPNVNLIGVGGAVGLDPSYSPASSNMPVQINGSFHSCAFTTSSSVTLDTIQFTNSGGTSTPFFEFTGSVACNLLIINCKINDGNINQDLFNYANSLVCDTEFRDSSFVQTNAGQFYSFSTGGAASATLLFNNCLLLCNDLGPQSAASITVTLNDCTFNSSTNVIINSTGSDGNTYTFNNCTLAGTITNVNTPVSYIFNVCRMITWAVTGGSNWFAVFVMYDCQVATTTVSLPNESTFPVGTLVTMENCWFTATIGTNPQMQYLVNKTHYVNALTTVFFTGAYQYKAQIANYTNGAVPQPLFQIPVDVPCSTLLNIAIVGNVTPTNPSTCSGFIKAGYYLPSGGSGIPVQNFISSNVASTGTEAATVTLIVGTGTISLYVTGTSLFHYWYATIEWSNVFANT